MHRKLAPPLPGGCLLSCGFPFCSPCTFVNLLSSNLYQSYHCTYFYKVSCASPATHLNTCTSPCAPQLVHLSSCTSLHAPLRVHRTSCTSPRSPLHVNRTSWTSPRAHQLVHLTSCTSMHAPRAHFVHLYVCTSTRAPQLVHLYTCTSSCMHLSCIICTHAPINLVHPLSPSVVTFKRDLDHSASHCLNPGPQLTLYPTSNIVGCVEVS